MLGSGPPPEFPVDLADLALLFWLFCCKDSTTLSSAAKLLSGGLHFCTGKEAQNGLRPNFLSFDMFGEELPLCV